MSSSQSNSLTEPSPPSDQSTPLLQEDRQLRYESPPPPPPDPEEVISWSSLPKKGQLAVIVFARLAEPLSERSLTSYLFYQLRWLGPDLSTAEIAAQAGYLTAMFAAAQCFTSMWWGHAADNPLLGRKRVLVIGLTGSCVSALGMGFSTSIYAVFFFRFLAGALNGNVGVLRTMISEVVDDRRYQSRAFLLLPMCFNVGVIIGPLLSGFLADPIHSLPSLFGPGSVFGGRDGVGWMATFPYALPNVFFAIVLGIAALAIILGLDETHPQLRHQPDRGRQLGMILSSKLLRRGSAGFAYQPLRGSDTATQSVVAAEEEGSVPSNPKDMPKRPPLSELLTRNVCLTMAQRFLQALVLLPREPALIWTCLSVVRTMHVMSRTFVNPATVMMVNDAAPRPELLGTVHGVASSVSSAARVMGPTIGGLLLGWGLSHNFVGLPLWLLSALAIVNWVILLWVDDDKMSG